jgi:hypothetical protein
MIMLSAASRRTRRLPWYPIAQAFTPGLEKQRPFRQRPFRAFLQGVPLGRSAKVLKELSMLMEHP